MLTENDRNIKLIALGTYSKPSSCHLESSSSSRKRERVPEEFLFGGIFPLILEMACAPLNLYLIYSFRYQQQQLLPCWHQRSHPQPKLRREDNTSSHLQTFRIYRRREFFCTVFPKKVFPKTQSEFHIHLLIPYLNAQPFFPRMQSYLN